MEQTFDGIDSGMIADALDALGFDGAMTGLMPLALGQRFHGRAVTVRMMQGTPGTFSPDEIALGTILEQVGVGDVIVIDVGGAPITVWGELTTIAAQHKGVAGLVVDGAVRDADIIRAAQFPVMTRHIVPKAGKTRLRLGSVNEEPVLCGGVSVHPGDFVFADETGVVVCPQSMTDSVMEGVRKIQAREAELKKHLARGLSYLEAARELGLRQL
jgi:regulator of RNase E activity RraA